MTTTATAPLFPFTVLLLRPDYIASEFGKDTYLAHVMARDPAHAAQVAQVEAFRADDGNDSGEDDAEETCAPDYYPLLTLAGHHSEGAAPVPPLHLRQKATVLAALRYWERVGTQDKEPPEGDIATDGDQFEPLNVDEIDALCEQINGAESPTPNASALAQALESAASLIEHAIDTHIYDEQNGEEPEPDCPYVATVKELRQLAQQIGGDQPRLLRDCLGAIDSLSDQIDQMKGLFPDEDKAIANALAEAVEVQRAVRAYLEG